MSFKRSDIQPCAVCQKGLLNDGMPSFYRLRIERFCLDANAIRRQSGLEMMMGSAAPLAALMGPNEDMAHTLSAARSVLVCETCSHGAGRLFPVLVGFDEAGS